MQKFSKTKKVWLEVSCQWEKVDAPRINLVTGLLVDPWSTSERVYVGGQV